MAAQRFAGSMWPLNAALGILSVVVVGCGTTLERSLQQHTYLSGVAVFYEVRVWNPGRPCTAPDSLRLCCMCANVHTQACSRLVADSEPAAADHLCACMRAFARSFVRPYLVVCACVRAFAQHPPCPTIVATTATPATTAMGTAAVAGATATAAAEATTTATADGGQQVHAGGRRPWWARAGGGGRGPQSRRHGPHAQVRATRRRHRRWQQQPTPITIT